VWKLRRRRLFLMPGDSPIGFRLPLDSLPRLKPVDQPFLVPADPFAERGALPEPAAMARTFGSPGLAPPHVVSGVTGAPAARLAAGVLVEGAPVPVRTALAVEPRDGRLCVFMPPTERLEDYLELLATVEATATSLNLPIHVEGYLPPPDPRLNVIKVTPDPGVIEVNIHPATSWREAVEVTSTLYEEARLTRLGADKFMIDGRHTGTGGGNHVVLGGAAPADSPFLRRPDLLKSLLSIFSVTRRCPTCFPACSLDRPAKRRGSTRRARISSTNSTSRFRWCRRRVRAKRRGRGWSIGCFATCWWTSPATRTAPSFASTSCSLRTDRPAVSGWLNFAPSKCRPMRA
jgi:uncharacterized protein (DUF2126 family)